MALTQSFIQFEFKFYVKQRDKEIKQKIQTFCGGCNVLKHCTELSKCGNCNCAYYCSAECQKNHWKEHKAQCYEICPKKN